MKGFIEVTLESGNKKEIYLKEIEAISSFLIETGNEDFSVKETYEEIKELIKKAQ